jgi:AAHS family 3-hydroxyphenylpropionic acid transporter
MAQTRSRRAVTIGLCFLVAVIEGFDIQAIGVAAPKLVPELGLSPDQVGWVFAVTNIGFFFGAVIGGWCADRLGRKPVLIGAVLTFGVLTLATTMVSSFEPLLAVRRMVGVGFGAALPNIMALAAEVSAPDRRAFTAGTIFCGMPAGGGTAALLTQYLPADYDWRILFVCGGIIPLLVMPFLWMFLRETATRGGELLRASVQHALFGEKRLVL